MQRYASAASLSLSAASALGNAGDQRAVEPLIAALSDAEFLVRSQAASSLQQLAWTYCHAIDRGDLKLVRSLYHDDAIDDHGPMFSGSPDEYVAWLPSMLANWEMTSHVISNMLFLIDGNQAEGELVVLAYHRTPAPGSRELIARGRYLDRYEKRDGIWRFLRRSLVLDAMEERATPMSEGPSLDEGMEKGRLDAGDACFTRLARFDRQRGLRSR